VSIRMTVEREGRLPKLDWDAASGLWASRAAPLGRQMLRARAPFRTGAFRQSVNDRQEASAGSRLVMFYSQVSYAKYIIGGTGPHPIAARNARALRWTGNSGHGAVMFAKRVNHPGTRPNRFAEDAMAAIGPAVAALFEASVKETMGL
jgi:hypothetical protein